MISPMTMAETVRPRGASAPIPIEHQERITDFFENDYMRFRIIDRLIAKRSLGLCWNAGLHPRDALHVAVALEEGCDVLETRDGKLLRNNGLEGLTIREPFWEIQAEMADDKADWSTGARRNPRLWRASSPNHDTNAPALHASNCLNWRAPVLRFLAQSAPIPRIPSREVDEVGDAPREPATLPCHWHRTDVGRTPGGGNRGHGWRMAESTAPAAGFGRNRGAGAPATTVGATRCQGSR